jgi:hypothetical protein
METKKKHIDENETRIEFSGNILIPRPEVEEFEKRLAEFIDEFAI